MIDNSLYPTFSTQFVINEQNKIVGEVYIYSDCQAILDLGVHDKALYNGQPLDIEDWYAVFVDANTDQILFKHRWELVQDHCYDNETILSSSVLELDEAQRLALFKPMSVDFFAKYQEDTMQNYTGSEQIEYYYDQVYPKKLVTSVRPMFNMGRYPLDCLVVYDGGDYWHLVTIGLSEEFYKENGNVGLSGYGLEFTMKISKSCVTGDEEIDYMAKHFYNALCTYAGAIKYNGERYKVNEWIMHETPMPIDPLEQSQLTGFITTRDDVFKTTYLLSGYLEFIELVGVTQEELEAIRDKKYSAKEMLDLIGSDVTDFNRNSRV